MLSTDDHMMVTQAQTPGPTALCRNAHYLETLNRTKATVSLARTTHPHIGGRTKAQITYSGESKKSVAEA